MPAEVCDHPIPPAFQKKLNDCKELGATSKCPICLVRSHVAEIKDIQAALEGRGGIFKSKTQYTSLTSPWTSHKDWMTKWRQAKIRFQRELEFLEELRNEDPLLAEESGLNSALYIWELEKGTCSLVPGYSYVSDKEDGVEKEARLNIAAEDESLAAEEMQDLWADGREWAVKPKRKSRRRRVIIEDQPQLEDKIASLSNSSFNGTPSPDELVLKEMTGITHRIGERLNMGSWNLFDAIAGVEASALTEPESDDSPSPPPSPTVAKVDEVTSSPTLDRLPVRSALKGSRPTPSPGIKPLKPQTSFAETTTIFSHHTHPPHPAGPAPIQEPHNKHTIAELARRNSCFYRPSLLYRPSTWASQAGFEKADTSYHKVSWLVRERMLERDDGEDLGMRRDECDGGTLRNGGLERGFRSEGKADDGEKDMLDELEEVYERMELIAHKSTGIDVTATPESSSVGKQLMLHPTVRNDAALSSITAAERMVRGTEIILHPTARKGVATHLPKSQLGSESTSEKESISL